MWYFHYHRRARFELIDLDGSHAISWEEFTGFLTEKGMTDDVVREFSDLEEDRFWRDEIATRLQEHLDELHARQSLYKEQRDAAKRSSESSPAKRDAAYALQVYTTDREFEIATRRRLDGDEMSEAYAATLQKREEALAEAERNAATQGEKKNVRMLGRLFAKLRGIRNGAQRRK